METGGTALDDEQDRIKHEPQAEASPSSTELKSVDQVQAFVVQLMKEYLAHHKFNESLAALQTELERKGLSRPDNELWYQMHSSCRVALAQRGSCTLEKLVAFCVSTKAQGAGVALDCKPPPVTLNLAPSHPTTIFSYKQNAFSLKQAYNQMLSPVVRPSQRHKHEAVAPPSGGVRRRLKINASECKELNTSNNLSVTSGSTMPRKKPKRKKKTNSGIETTFKIHPRFSKAGSVVIGEQIKRDLSSGRNVARELRNLRIEQDKCDVLRRDTELQQAALARNNSYTHEVVRAQYGSIHRLKCALCAFLFLPINLPYIVPFKSIMDLHKLWGYHARDREGSARYRPPFCYDAVRVCRMCGPILFSHTTAVPLADDQGTAMTRVKSLNVMSNISPKTNDQEGTFCSDPYALPPLFSDEVSEDVMSPGEQVSTEAYRSSHGVKSVTEPTVKAIEYFHPQAYTPMTSKEWKVIDSSRGNVRQIFKPNF